LPGEPGYGGDGCVNSFAPFAYGDNALGSPILLACLVFDVEQNAKAARAGGRSVEFGAIGVEEFVADSAAACLGAVAKEPGVICAGRFLRGEGDFIAWNKDRWIDGESGNGISTG
jgi:hypothetical protein